MRLPLQQLVPRPVQQLDNLPVLLHLRFFARREEFWMRVGQTIAFRRLLIRASGDAIAVHPIADRAMPECSPSQTDDERRSSVPQVLDNACTGPLFLRISEIVTMVSDAIHYRERNLLHYQLHSYVVMPNHVHLLVTPLREVSKVMQSLKRVTAREGNRILSRTGQPFWQDESYDRLVRNKTEFQRIANYIEMNPVKCGLAATPEEFPWSSARPINNRPQVANLPHSDNCGAGC